MDSSDRFHLVVDEEIEFFMSKEQLKYLENAEDDSFYSCKTNCTLEQSYVDPELSASEKPSEYDDITPVFSDVETTPTRFPNLKDSLCASPKTLVAIAKVAAQFKLIQGDETIPNDPASKNPPVSNNICSTPPSSNEDVAFCEAQNDTEASIPLNDSELNAQICDNPVIKITDVPSKSLDEHLLNERFEEENKENTKTEIERKFSVNKLRVPPNIHNADGGKTSRPAQENTQRTLLRSHPQKEVSDFDVKTVSERLFKTNLTQKKKTLLEQSLKNSKVHLSKLVTPNIKQTPSKVAEYIKSPAEDRPQIRTMNQKTVSRIPLKIVHQSSRVFGKKLASDTLLNSPSPLITIHSHPKTASPLRINESIYETFEARVKKQSATLASKESARPAFK